MRENPLPSKVMVAERLEPFIRVSEDVFTDLNLGPSLCSSCPYTLEKLSHNYFRVPTREFKAFAASTVNISTVAAL